MNWSIEYFDQLCLVKVSCEGQFTLAECLRMHKDFLSRECWKPGGKLLLDCRQLTFNGVKTNDIRTLAESHVADNERYGSGKMAYLMNTLRDFGLARQYEIITEGRILSEIHVFRNEDESMAWLNVE